MEQPTEQGLTLTSQSLKTLDKDGLQALAQHMVYEVLAGNQDGLELMIDAKKIELFAKEVIENIKSHVYGKTYATKGNPLHRFGAKVEAAELGTEYSYENCNDSTLIALTEAAEKAKCALDARKKFLQTLPAPTDIVTKDFEVVTIYPAVKKSTNGYKITL